MYKRWILVTIAFFVLNNGFSQSSEQKIIYAAEGYHFPYNLTQADKKYKLPGDLVEISGLSYYKNNQLACVQDEKDNIYFFDLDKGEVVNKIKFGKNADYEGVEIINNTAWVLKSNGNLYRVKNIPDEDEIKVKKYESNLSEKNDTEGLGFDAANQRLLIACKGYPYMDKKGGKNKKAIYVFNIETKTLEPEPAFIINLDVIRGFLKFDRISNFGVNFLSWLDPSKGDVSFQPSGIAVHPVSGNIFIIATVGKLLIVLKPDGDICSIVRLDPKVFKQPEGICFDPLGNLYISNEGRSGKGNILKFGQ